MINRDDKLKSVFGEYPLILNGYQLPTPRSDDYTVGRNFVQTSNSKRANATGAKMHKKTMAIKTTVSVSYVNLDSGEFSKIYETIGIEQGQEFVTLKYFDPFVNSVVSKSFYVPDISAVLTSVTTKSKYINVTLEFIEE